MLVYQRVNTIQLYTTLIFYSAPFVNVGVQLLEECCASFEPKPMQNARTSSAPFLDWFHARAQEVEHQGRRQRWIWWLMSWRQLSLIILLIKSDDIHNIRNQTSLYKLRLYIYIYHQYIINISPLYHHYITMISPLYHYVCCLNPPLCDCFKSSPASASPPARAPTQQRRKGRGVAAGHRLHEAGIALQDPGRVQGRDLEAKRPRPGSAGAEDDGTR